MTRAELSEAGELAAEGLKVSGGTMRSSALGQLVEKLSTAVYRLLHDREGIDKQLEDLLREGSKTGRCGTAVEIRGMQWTPAGWRVRVSWADASSVEGRGDTPSAAVADARAKIAALLAAIEGGAI